MYTNHQELHGDACDTMEDDNIANQPLLSESDLPSSQEVLILSLQATISNLEDKVSALRKSELTCRIISSRFSHARILPSQNCYQDVSTPTHPHQT